MKTITTLLLIAGLAGNGFIAHAQSYELIYKEEEPGIDPYLVRISITNDHLRIDDLSDDSGYILYDSADDTVYSVSHFDNSVLVIRGQAYERPALSQKLVTADKPLDDAPRIAGKVVHDYRVQLKSDDIDEMCTHIQYVPGLLEGAGAMLHAWQKVMSGQHVLTLEQTPSEYQTPCMLSDQVYFDGSIYKKGLPVMEWRSNGRQRYLQNYSERGFDETFFRLPEGYRRIEMN